MEKSDLVAWSSGSAWRGLLSWRGAQAACGTDPFQTVGKGSFDFPGFDFMACMATLARDSFAPGNMPITMDTDYYYYYGRAPEHRQCWQGLAVE